MERLLIPTTPTIVMDGTTGGEEGGKPYCMQRGDGGGDGDDDAAIYRIHCTCHFFLYKMVRRIVGVLVAMGGGGASLDALRLCLGKYNNYYYHGNPNNQTQNNNGTTSGATKGEKKPAFPPKLLNTALAKGLCLENIEYDIAI